jgi:hypothetical protein
MSKRVLWVIEGRFEHGWEPVEEEATRNRALGRHRLAIAREEEPAVSWRLAKYEAVEESR